MSDEGEHSPIFQGGDHFTYHHEIKRGEEAKYLASLFHTYRGRRAFIAFEISIFHMKEDNRSIQFSRSHYFYLRGDRSSSGVSGSETWAGEWEWAVNQLNFIFFPILM